MHQFDYLEEEWDEKIQLKFNCCNDEFWSNASLRDLAPDAPIWLSEEKWRQMMMLNSLFNYTLFYEDLKIKTNNYVDDIPFMKLFTKGPYSLNMKFSIEKLIAFTSW